MNFIPTPKRIAILGTEAHAKVAASIAEQNGYEVFFFDDCYPQQSQFGVWPVRGNKQAIEVYGYKYDAVFVSYACGLKRKKALLALKQLGLNVVSLISPSAKVSEFAQIGQGSLIVAKVYVGFGTTIGDGCIINVGTNIDFDCTIKSYATIAQGVNIAPRVTVGDFTRIYIGANLIEEIQIGDSVVAGAGAVILNDVPNDVTVVGCPARIVNKR